MTIAKGIAASAVFALALLPGLALAESRTIELPAFTGIEIGSGIDAIVTIGETQSVVVEASSAERIDELKIDVAEGHLRAWVDWTIFDMLPFDAQQITLRITVPAIDTIDAGDGADVDATGPSGETVTLRAWGGADISVKEAAGVAYVLESSSGADLTVTGTCASAALNASSGAGLDASGLLCADITLDASSGSGMQAFASENAKGAASSGSDVTIFGGPKASTVEPSSGADVHYAD